MVASVKPTFGNTNAHQLRRNVISLATASMLNSAMQKNQSARLQMNTATIVASNSSMRAVACLPTPKKLVVTGHALAMPIIASEVKAGGPTAMNIAGLLF